MRPEETARLDFLLGDWTSIDQVYPGPQEPGGNSEGTASYKWQVGGTWLQYEFRTNLPGLGPYEVHGGFRHDAAADEYRAYAVNSLGKLLVYSGHWEGDDTLVFTLVYPERQEDTRVCYTKLPDGGIRMTSERPAEGGGRKVYFETILSK
jgi:hypothetical protein